MLRIDAQRANPFNGSLTFCKTVFGTQKHCGLGDVDYIARAFRLNPSDLEDRGRGGNTGKGKGKRLSPPRGLVGDDSDASPTTTRLGANLSPSSPTQSGDRDCPRLLKILGSDRRAWVIVITDGLQVKCTQLNTALHKPVGFPLVFDKGSHRPRQNVNVLMIRGMHAE